MAGALSVALACGIPFFAGCNEDQIKDLESQISTLQSEKAQLTTDKTNLQTDKTNLESQVSTLQSEKTQLTNDKTNLQNQNAQLINTATYQMLCAVMSQLSICDMDTKIMYDNDSNKDDEKYSSYKTFVRSANKFVLTWNKVVNSSKVIEMNTSYKLVNSADSSDYEIVLFNFYNGHYYAYIYADKLAWSSWAAGNGLNEYNRTCLMLDMVYQNGAFSSISMRDIIWARTVDNEGKSVQNSQMRNDSIKISFDSTQEELSNRWVTTPAGADENNLEGGVIERVNATFDEEHTITA